MNLSKTLIFLTLVICVCPGGENTLFAQETLPGYNPQKGQKLFAAKGCINCHSVYGFGGKIGSDLGRSLANKEALDIIAVMWNHSNEMSKALERGQSVPQLAPPEMAAILSFFYYLNYFGTPGSAGQGALIFQNKGCSACHSVDQNNKTNSPNLFNEPFSSPLQLGQALWNHGGKMMARIRSQGIRVPTLSGSEITDIFAFLRGRNPVLFYKPQEAIPGDYKTGARLIREKQCLRCHSMGGKGGKMAPDFTQINLHRNAVEIVAMMLNHAPRMWRKMKENSIASPTFTGTNLADLVAYLYFSNFRIPTGNAVKGEKLFQEKQCNKCHSLQLSTKRIGPNLAIVQGLDEMINISSAMWNHNINMLEQMQRQNIPFPRFNGEELKNLLTFIRSVREKEHEEK